MHSVILAILPNTGDKYGDDDLGDIMSPYWKGLSVEEYETECYCVNMDAQMAAQSVANEKYPMDDIRDKFNKAVSVAIPQSLKDEQAKWNALQASATPEYKQDAFIDFCDRWNTERNKLSDKLDIKNWSKDHDEMEKQTEESHPLYKKPSPDCEECEGTGWYMTICNPDGKWDWYQVGGRWDGMLNGLNQMSVDELIKVYEKEEAMLPTAIVTDYDWHDGQTELFGEPDDDWRDNVIEILSSHKGQGMVAVVVDIHF